VGINSEVAGFFSSKWSLKIRDFVIVIYLNLNPSLLALLACLWTHQLHSRLFVLLLEAFITRRVAPFSLSSNEVCLFSLA
jgi:hypothetical protein